ncbi:trimeric intracellular cation channel family protein [uncultured Polaribacter sp.]|uniref:trimeric intracellular cation channel family protein n=1 Tax=uncultured Polaribacter sp. TaxID=174711 RepID=UPI00262ECC29|nr:trimeric intracellular cation channel family protein [uncultured Polaribacter sp.]
MNIIYAIDILGTFAFAISGALVALDKKLDVFGVIIIAFVTAVGGGMLRDILIDAHPINWIGDLNYLYTIFMAVVVTFLFKSKISHLSKTMFLFDTVGLGVFTLLGLKKGISYNLQPIIALIMGMISAVFGGVLRDVLTNKIPLIFEKEIYASACLVGGFTYMLINKLTEVPENINFIIASAVVIIIRVVAVKFHLELPKIKNDVFTKK